MNIQLLKSNAIYILLISALALVMLIMIGLFAIDASASGLILQDDNVAGDLLAPNVVSLNATFDGCMVERYNQVHSTSETNLNCTANDVGLASYTLLSGPTACLEGEDITVTLLGQFVSTASERWDIGVFVATDGGNPNALGGKCYNDYLNPVSADNSDLNLSGGLGPFYNGEISEDPGDTCGDIQQGQNAFFQTEQITIKCEDSNDNGIADVNSCTVWSNATSDGSENKPSCTSETDTTAETKAKCTCGNVEIAGLKVPLGGTIEVVKAIDPTDAPGVFNLQIDGQTEFPDAGNGDSTGPVDVSAGFSTDDEPIGDTHTVGETAGTGTDLGLYAPAISCQDQENDTASAEGAGPLEIFVEPGDAWVCTITNVYLVTPTEPTVTETEETPTETPVTETPETVTPTEPTVTETPETPTKTPVTEIPDTVTPTNPPATETPVTPTDAPATPTATKDVRTPTPLPTLAQPTSPVETSQVLIPETGLDLSGEGAGISLWLLFFLCVGFVGIGIVFFGISTQISRK